MGGMAEMKTMLANASIADTRTVLLDVAEKVLAMET